MIKRCFIVAMTLLIALQSVASIAYETQPHNPAMPHYDAHSHESADFSSENQATKSSPGSPSHSADHGHHSHSCFHMVLLGTLTNISGLTAGIVLSDYQANFTTGVQSSLFRPPIF